MNCCFCEEYMHPLQSQFYKEIGCKIGCPTRILLETDNWFVIPTVGSLTVGYVLLVCKQHYLSLANIPWTLYREMLTLKMNVESILHKQLGLHCLTFEHGTPNPLSKGANSVDHVHIHVLPFERPIWHDIETGVSSKDIEAVANYGSLYSIWQTQLPNSYLLFQDINQRIYYIPDASNMPSQLFRKCLAPYLGAPCWDWKSEAYVDSMVHTMALFKHGFC